MTARDPVAAARALLEKATKGPWEAADQTGTEGHGMVAQIFDGDGRSLAEFEYPNGTANAVFCAAARTLVPELAAECERLRGEKERLKLAPTGLPEGEADWRDHPVIEADPAEAAQAEERARIEALAREDSEQSRIRSEQDLDDLRAEGIDPESLGDEA